MQAKLIIVEENKTAIQVLEIFAMNSNVRNNETFTTMAGKAIYLNNDNALIQHDYQPMFVLLEMADGYVYDLNSHYETKIDLLAHFHDRTEPEERMQGMCESELEYLKRIEVYPTKV